jgi:hypothetical protein
MPVNAGIELEQEGSVDYEAPSGAEHGQRVRERLARLGDAFEHLGENYQAAKFPLERPPAEIVFRMGKAPVRAESEARIAPGAAAHLDHIQLAAGQRGDEGAGLAMHRHAAPGQLFGGLGGAEFQRRAGSGSGLAAG